jgi:Fis family transcriptional regulator, factor for inversion stimulation protein
VYKLLEQLVSQMVEKGIHYDDAMREFDRRFIVEVMDKTDGNLTKAADTLGVHRNTLARKIKELKIKTRQSAG